MPASVSRWTVERLDSLPDDGNRYEIVDGELFASPPLSEPHQGVVDRLAELLREHLTDSQLAELRAAPHEVRAGDRTVVKPELFVVVPSVDRTNGAPAQVRDVLLVIELLTPATAKLDCFHKRLVYQREGVREYWIVDADARMIERWSPDDETPQTARERIAWTAPGAARPLEIELATIFD